MSLNVTGVSKVLQTYIPEFIFYTVSGKYDLCNSFVLTEKFIAHSQVRRYYNVSIVLVCPVNNCVCKSVVRYSYFIAKEEQNFKALI